MRPVIAVISALSVLTIPARAQPVPGLDVVAIAADSDLIVVANVTRPAVGAGTGAVSIVHVIKGSLPHDTGTLAALLLANTPRMLDYYAIFALQRNADRLDCTDTTFCALVAAPEKYQALPLPAEPLGQMAAYFASVFNTPLSVTQDPSAGLERGPFYVGHEQPTKGPGRYVTAMRPANQFRLSEDVYQRALMALMSVPPMWKTQYEQYIVDHSAQKYGRLWAYAALLQAGDVSRYAAALDYLQHAEPQAEQTNSMLGLAIRSPTFPSEAIPFLTKIALSPSPAIRAAALYQLRRTEPVRAADVFFQALNDPDGSVHREAVLGVCGIIQTCGAYPNWRELSAAVSDSKLAALVAQWRITTHHPAPL